LHSIPFIFPITTEIKDKLAKVERIILINKYTNTPVGILDKPVAYPFK
jgi:hypothetical protein